MNLNSRFGKNWKSDPIRILSADNLGLIPSQIIYVEACYNPFVNDYIQRNYNDIAARFKQKSAEIDFIYLPKIQNDFVNSQKGFEDLLNYFFPDRINTFKNVSHNSLSKDELNTSFMTKQLFSTLKFKHDIFPGMLRLSETRDPSSEKYIFEYYAFDCSEKDTLDLQIDYYISKIYFDYRSGQIAFNSSEDIDYSIQAQQMIFMSDEQPMCTIETRTKKSKKSLFKKFKKSDDFLMYDSLNNDESFANVKENSVQTEQYSISCELQTISFSEEYNTIENIKNDILRLKQLGFYVPLMHAIGDLLLTKTSEKPEPKLSRLTLDSRNYTIYLQDYNNMEIAMTTLPKVLYILFLRHPAGIILKQLSDYEPELMAIYKLISNREKTEDMEKSIHRICSPLDSSVNEKLSRIKEAFVHKIPENGYAEHYFVTGGRGEKKQIKIDRELVSLPDCFDRVIFTKN
jgi:hypothetical protein